MKCSYCGHDISDKAAVCPHCGEPNLHKEEREKSATIIGGKKIYLYSNGPVSKSTSDYDKTYLILSLLFGAIVYFFAVVKESEEGKKGAAYGIIINYFIALAITLIWLLNRYVI